MPHGAGAERLTGRIGSNCADFSEETRAILRAITAKDTEVRSLG